VSAGLSFEPSFPPLKWLRKLSGAKSELSEKYCLVEGWKCISEAWSWGVPHLLLCTEKTLPELKAKGWAETCAHYSLGAKEFEELCSTQNPEGVLGVFSRPAVSTQAPSPQVGEVHLGLYQWRDPSNIGAAVRSARGLGAASVTLMGSGPDFFSAKVIRCAMASVFHLPLHHIDVDMDQLKDFELVMAAAGGVSSRTWQPESRPTFLLIGSESHGLPADILQQGKVLGIPLARQLESLSAPIASALLLDHLLHPRVSKEN
jgi:RNA methyltransferase, TrmH family